MSIEGKVKEILVEQMGIREEDVHLDSVLVKDLRVDELDSVEIIMALEEKFDIEIPDEDAEKLTTVKEIVEYLKGKVEVKDADSNTG